MTDERTYLGDGVYVEYVDGAMLRLSCGNGGETERSIVYLEWDVFDNLLRYVEQIKAEAIKASKV